MSEKEVGPDRGRESLWKRVGMNNFVWEAFTAVFLNLCETAAR
jgi:hypothetical protein